MCIALLSTAHPAYQLILIDNRDEYLNRPTARAEWWPAPNSDVLGGRDLLRDAQGTWLGITRVGKIAVLTNFREKVDPPPDAVSRGAIMRKWLTEDVGSTEEFVSSVVDTGVARDAGGFSLVCGKLGERLAVISNRAADPSQVPRIGGDTIQTVGLSNAAFTDRTWPKVRDGEELMLHTIRENLRDQSGEDALIENFLDLLSRDTLKRAGDDSGAELATYIPELRNTIFVPALGRRDEAKLPGDEIALAQVQQKVAVVPVGSDEQPSNLDEESKSIGKASTVTKKLGVSGLYGTQRQTVVLVGHEGRVRFFERALYDSDCRPIPRGQGDIEFEFHLREHQQQQQQQQQ